MHRYINSWQGSTNGEIKMTIEKKTQRMKERENTFTAAGHKILVEAPKARVDGVEALGDTLELTHQTLVLDVPEVNALTTTAAHSQPNTPAAIREGGVYTVTNNRVYTWGTRGIYSNKHGEYRVYTVINTGGIWGIYCNIHRENIGYIQ